MKSATDDALDKEQQIVHNQLSEAVEKINEAKELLPKQAGNNSSSDNAIALSLMAIAKVLVVSKAAEFNMVSRLPQFK